MLFAVAQMDPTVQMLFYGLAFVLFVLSAIGVAAGRVSLLAAGLAAFTFPAFWQALAAS